MTDEVELKLELSAKAADEIEASGLLPGLPKVAQQVSTYFDTADHVVARAGFSLRIRRTGEKRIQTIKADGAAAAGLFVRSEWERPVESDAPVLDFATPLPALLGDAADDVAPLFEVHIERRIWMIEENSAVAELVLDRGEAVAGDRRSSICEIELELKSGQPAALFAFARKLDAIAAVRLGVQTKSERGYRMTEPAPTSVKAAPVPLRSDMKAAEAFRTILASCIRHYRLNETPLLAGHDPEALHQARIALRRLRSAFSIFKQVIGEDGEYLRGELRWLASEFGNVRDLDVLFERTRPGMLRERLTAARADAYDSLYAVLAAPRARGLMLSVAAWAAESDWTGRSGGETDGNQPVGPFAGKTLGRLRRKIKKQGQDIAGVDDEVRHEVRKLAKELRYASEFFAALFVRKPSKRRHKRFLTALEDLQDQLGALNDIAAAPEVLARLGAVEAAEADFGDNTRDKAGLLKRAEAAHEELIDTKKFW